MDSQGKSFPSLLLELLDCVEDLVLILDAKLRIVEANRGAVICFGYSKASLKAMRLHDLLAIDERKRVTQLVVDTEERHGGAAVFRTYANRKVRVRFSVSRAAESGEKSHSFLLVAHRPADDARQADDDSSNGLAARMLKGFVDPLFVIDGPSRTVRDCNDAALAAFGFSRDELIGQRLLDHTKNVEERQRNREAEERADTTYATMGIFQERILFPRKDAPPIPCYITSLPFFNRDGSLDLIIAMLFDRSVEEAREAELADLIGQINSLATQLSGTASAYTTHHRRERLSELGFTPRQIEITRQIAAGVSSKDVAFRMGIAESTVKNHLAVMYRKLKVNSRLAFMRAIATKRIKIE